MPEVFVGRSQDLKEGERRIVTSGPHSVGVLRANGKLYAYRNECPHQGGPVCEGLMVHKVEEIIAPDKTYRGMRYNRDELNIVCPWHGWEFNIETGRCAGDGRHGLRKYPVVERQGEIYVVM
jgi:nitrite reductase/ring-hydroxylating ferredoxin subunit